MDAELVAVGAAVDAALVRAPWALSDDALSGAIAAVHAVATKVSVLLAGLVAEASGRGLPAKDGATSPGVWLRGRLHISARAGAGLADLGGQVGASERVREALLAGSLNVEQAGVIRSALEALPRDLDPDVRAACEASLLTAAKTLDATHLRRAGVHVLEHVAPAIGEAALAAKLERDELLATQNRYLSLLRDGARVQVRGSLDSEAAAVLHAALDPLCRPIPGPDGGRDPRTAGQRRADALRDVCALSLASAELPDRGGIRPQVTVTMHYDPLRGLIERLRAGGLPAGGFGACPICAGPIGIETGAAPARIDPGGLETSSFGSGAFGIGYLDSGEPLSPATVRRIACDARIIPAVLDGEGAILDMGRGRRLWTYAARAAVIQRDGGCAFPGCDRPPQWCEVHHRISWLLGGRTDLDNGCFCVRRTIG